MCLENKLMCEKLLIIGASGHGKVIADIAVCMGKYKEIVFLDDNDQLSRCMGFPVLGSTKEIATYVSEYEIVVAIGNAKIRRRIMDEIDRLQGMHATLQHPQAVVSCYAQIGVGSVIMPGAVVNAGAVIGRGCKQ